MRTSKTSKDAEGFFEEAERHEEAGDFKRAFTCLLSGAKLGHTGCQINLGNFYSDGKGKRKNKSSAAYWYQKAYKNGDRVGALNLGIDRKNEGRTRSAVIWFKKGVALKDGDSCLQLAKLYKERQEKRDDAIELLRSVLPMNRADISEEGKEEARSLLHEMGAI